MKIKYLILISLLLAILTIGAVSASQNLTDDDSSQTACDSLPAEEIKDDSLSQFEDMGACESEISKQSDNESGNEIISSSQSDEDVLGDYYSGKIHIEVFSSVDLSNSYYELGYVSDNNGITGTISVAIDGKNVFSKKFTSGKTNYYSIDRDDINLMDYGYGYHNVKITYNDGNAKSDSRNVNFVYEPSITTPYFMSVGETSYVTIKGASGMSGTATLYSRDVVGYDKYNESIYTKGGAIATVKIKNGKAIIPLKIISSKDQSFQLDYSIGTYKDSYVFYVEVGNNTPGFKSSISAKSIIEGKSVTIKLTGPKSANYVSIYVDGKFLKEVKFTSGSLKEIISGLSVGTHYISLNLNPYGSKVFYSNTFKVVVKSKVKLTLKKVAVKKSAKKLVLKATLKISNKPVKGKKLTFKFNGKKYTAKTNKNGVAKVTIKKSVLKKLKVGKKIRYQVAYAKTVKKLTVKVKK